MRTSVIVPLFLFLAACSNATSPPVLPPSAAIGGAVVSNGGPAGGAFIRLKVPLAIVTAQTDPSGAFYFFSDPANPLPPSYQLTVYDALGAPRHGTLFLGLGRRDPTLAIQGARAPATWTAHVSVALPPAADGVVTSFFLSDADHPAKLVSVQPGPTFADGVTITWVGPYAMGATLHALEYRVDPTTKRPQTFVGHAAQGFSFVAGSTFYVLGAQLDTTVTTSVVPVQLSLPDGYALTGADLSLDFGASSTSVPLAHLDGASLPPSVAVPSTVGGRVVLRATATRGDETSRGTVVATGATAQATLSAAPAILAPGDGASGVTTTTTFSWDKAGVHEVSFVPADARNPSFSVVTADGQTTIPDLGDIGLTLPKAATYAVRVRRFATLDSIDKYADFAFVPDEAGWAESAARTFTTAP